MTYLFTTLKKTLLLLLFIICLISCSNDDTDPKTEYKYFITATSEKHVSKNEIIKTLDATFPGFGIASNPLFAAMVKDIDITAITYRTTGVDGKEAIASGIVAMLTGTTSYDHLLSVQHATVDMEEAPSKQMFYYEVAPVILGHVVVLPDYLGYGVSQTSDRQHPYLHIENTGRVCADMIEAAREYLHSKQIKESGDKIELMGYSQGANSTMATVFELEKRKQAARIRGVHAGGGVYDIVETMNSFLKGSLDGSLRMGYSLHG